MIGEGLDLVAKVGTGAVDEVDPDHVMTVDLAIAGDAAPLGPVIVAEAEETGVSRGPPRVTEAATVGTMIGAGKGSCPVPHLGGTE